MINNLTRDNLDGKADELKKALKPDMWPWFCNYMVIRRVAQEANHQNLYMQVTIGTARECTMGSLPPLDATALKRFVDAMSTQMAVENVCSAALHADSHLT